MVNTTSAPSGPSAPAALTKVSILGKETILVGLGLLDYLVNDVISNVVASTYIVVTDRNIARVHLSPLVNALQAEIQRKYSDSTKPRVLSYVMPPGEAAKTREVKSAIEDWALANKCTRDSCFLALGGGVIGDLIGFVAATFMRGVPFIQIPTSLLAMVDSSIGGKTAVDTPHGKNLIGSFHQPERIFIDLNYLRTLPFREFVNGLGEVIKTAAIWVEEDFDLLENHPEQILALSQGADGGVDSEEVQLLLRVILGSVRVKAHVVTADEKEGGLRGLLNFGHSIGHAIEAILSPEMLHGECVSLGMVREAEIARHLGFLNDVAVGRLVRCLQAYGLPVSLEDKIVKQRVPHKHCPVDQLLDIMRIDKKNQGDKKKIVMLAGIGRTVEPRASVVPDDVIRKILSPAMQITPPSASSSVDIKVPGSKSLSNRALVLAALGEGECRLHGLLHSDDVQVMLDALQKLVGITFAWENDGETLVITGGGGRLRVPSKEVYLGNAGTAARFLTTVCALIPTGRDGIETAVVTGNPRMQQRPIGPLVDALRNNGVNVEYRGKEGSLPLEIKPNGSGLPGGLIKLSASVSSQYVSSILISAPYAKEPVTLDLSGEHVISQPYIDMTIAMMDSFGIKVDRVNGTNTYKIPRGVYKNPANYYVEADASSATYPLAYAAITGSRVTVTNIGSKSLQGDAEFAIKVIAAMGGKVEQTETTTTVQGPTQLLPIETIHMETMTDAFLTASVLAAVAMGKTTTKITGIANQRVKECNRIAVMVEQLAKFGVTASELPDGIEIQGIDRALLRNPEGGVKCYDDHRVAMSFSILACALPKGGNAIIKEKKCVEKTWPAWWDALQNKLGVSLAGIDLEDEEQELKAPAASDAAKSATSDLSKPVINDATVVLIGMRGAGKTHAGKAAAKAFSRKFIDMDHYLEESLQTTIPKFIADKGWDEFRRQETVLLGEALTKFPTGAVIACGGGIVETPEARRLLKNWAGLETGASRRGLVVHVKRDIQDVSAYLSQDKTRPMYGEDMINVWNRRKAWYRECSVHEFVIVHSDAENWPAVESDLAKFLTFNLTKQQGGSSVLPGNVPAPPGDSFFVSLTFPDVEQTLPLLDKISEGADAIELRVDLLSSHDEESVGKQVALLRRHSPLPIVYTVRTKAQAGKFPDADHEHRYNLLVAGLRWGCEYVDIEIDGFSHDQLDALVAAKSNSYIVASYHDMTGSALWEEQGHGSSLLGNQKAQQSVAIRFRDVYDKLNPYADIIKLIGFATSMEDNFALQRFRASLPAAAKPLIAMNMGSLGQLSRALNLVLTPVTHPALPTRAAPGQLSIAEIYRLRTLIGLTQPKQFYLFGAPISQSVSPALHNSGFTALGLPHQYDLAESPDIAFVKDTVDAAVKAGTFGGASVTIPHKQDVIKHNVVQHLTPAAKEIGAVNTIFTREDPATGMATLWGDNTDWIGMHSAISEAAASLPTSSADQRTQVIGVVLGAGGTARAALYTLQRLGCDQLRIWNRTPENAAPLVSAFGATYVPDLSTLLAPPSSTTSTNPSAIFYIISTVPAPAQSQLGLDALFTTTHPTTATGVVVDMAYRPKITPLLSIVTKNTSWTCIPGIEILIKQGLKQFEIWTNRKAPEAVVRENVASKYGE